MKRSAFTKRINPLDGTNARTPHKHAGRKRTVSAATRLGFTPTIFAISADASDSDRAALRVYRNRLKRQRRERGVS